MGIVCKTLTTEFDSGSCGSNIARNLHEAESILFSVSQKTVCPTEKCSRPHHTEIILSVTLICNISPYLVFLNMYRRK
jgi:hypothetical protein